MLCSYKHYSNGDSFADLSIVDESTLQNSVPLLFMFSELTFKFYKFLWGFLQDNKLLAIFW